MIAGDWYLFLFIYARMRFLLVLSVSTVAFFACPSFSLFCFVCISLRQTSAVTNIQFRIVVSYAGGALGRREAGVYRQLASRSGSNSSISRRSGEICVEAAVGGDRGCSVHLGGGAAAEDAFKQRSQLQEKTTNEHTKHN